MKLTISQEFRFGSLMRFTFPTVVMMVFMSLYTIVDGMFVSQFVGTDALSAVNIVFPFISVIIAVSVMFATGGSAVIARQMGEGKKEMACRNFTAIVLFAFFFGVVLGVLGLIFIRPLVAFLGADESLVSLCVDYLRLLLIFAPASVLQMLYQSFLVVAGKPVLGLTVIIAGGVANMVLDYIFIVPCGMGISGAALATAIGYMIPAIIGTIFFFCQHKELYFVRPYFSKKIIWESCTNGSSEMVTNLSGSVVTILFNLAMMRMLGADGVASITIVLYTQYLMTALFMGFSLGVAPIFSYHFGSGNQRQLKKVFKISMVTVICTSVIICLVALLTAPLLSRLFSGTNQNVYDVSLHGLKIFSIGFLFAGVNIFSSALFTALSNGGISAAISFLRTFVFIVAGILCLPLLFQENGIWMAIPIAELFSFIFAAFCLVHGKKRYHYI